MMRGQRPGRCHHGASRHYRPEQIILATVRASRGQDAVGPRYTALAAVKNDRTFKTHKHPSSFFRSFRDPGSHHAARPKDPLFAPALPSANVADAIHTAVAAAVAAWEAAAFAPTAFAAAIPGRAVAAAIAAATAALAATVAADTLAVAAVTAPATAIAADAAAAAAAAEPTLLVPGLSASGSTEEEELAPQPTEAGGTIVGVKSAPR